MQVFQTIDGVEVYVNEGGCITIEQDDHMGGDHSFVVVPLMHVNALCKALRAVAKEAQEEFDA
jgi:hypothetical protein